jgi:hypothetical protein
LAAKVLLRERAAEGDPRERAEEGEPRERAEEGEPRDREARSSAEGERREVGELIGGGLAALVR